MGLWRFYMCFYWTEIMPQRQQQLNAWLEKVLGEPKIKLEPLAGDASFRRYFRLKHQNNQYVAMDSPPDKEPCLPFVCVDQAFRGLGLEVPIIFSQNIDAGFLLLSDLGNRLYVKELNSENVSHLYINAINKLPVIQQCKEIPGFSLESFNQNNLLEELNNFTYWFLERYLKLTLSASQSQTLEDTYKLLHENACEQPQVCIHRDYHSRNLMVRPNNGVGILDFQDAMLGPITYDLVSLIRDCYIDWPNEQVKKWALYYRQLAVDAGLLQQNITENQFLRWFDLMGMQRHLKATFIFVRKFLRDNDHTYLYDIPRTLNYVKNVCLCYDELRNFRGLLENILPMFEKVCSK